MAAVTITAANVKISTDPAAKATRGEAFAGAAITRGQPVAKHPITGQLHPADSSDAELHKVVGIALQDVAADQPLDYVIKDPLFRPGFSATAGKFYALGAAAGEIELITSTFPASADYGVIIGCAINSTIMPVNFSSSSWGGLTA